MWNFNIPRSTCMYKTTYCDEFCYAAKGSFNFPVVKNSMARNLEETKSEAFVRMMSVQIHTLKIKWVRIHACGDYYSQEYIDKWLDIAANCPETKFLSYTRNYEADFSLIPSNFVVYYSIDKETKCHNPTLSLESNAFDTDEKFQHMALTPHGFVCNSKCKICKACWAGKIDIFFPVRH